MRSWRPASLHVTRNAVCEPCHDLSGDCVRPSRGCAAISAVLLCTILAGAGATVAAPKSASNDLRIGVVFDGPGQGIPEVRALVRSEIEKIAAGDFRVESPDDKRIT